jgi:hypothetical protein
MWHGWGRRETPINVAFLKNCNYFSYLIIIGARGGVVVEALFYKPEGRGFENR